MDDSQILELLGRRDERAIGELRQKYGGLCLYVAGNVLSRREDAEECVSSALFAVWSQVPPETPRDLKTYLCRIVRNLAVKRLQYNTAEKRNPQFTVSLEEIAECTPARDRGSDTELADAVSRFLRSQDELHRRVFLRRYWYGDSLSRIAETFGMKEKTVATWLFRTRKKLKEALRKEGYEYE